MELEICPLPGDWNTCPDPGSTQFTQHQQALLLCLRLSNSYYDWQHGDLKSLYSACAVNSLPGKTIGLQDLAPCQSYLDLNFIRQKFTLEFKNWKTGWRSYRGWSFVAEESCLLFYGQISRGSLKWLPTRKKYQKNTWKSWSKSKE